MKTDAVRMYRGLKARRLHLGHYAILLLCREYRVTVTGLADALGVTKAAVSIAATTLQEQGLVTLRAAFADQRKRRVDLTPEGAALLRGMERGEA